MAAQEKYKLTEEHKAQLGPWAEMWTKNALSTKAMDEEERGICRRAVVALYKAANLTPPKNIVFVSSPFVLSFGGGFSSAIWWNRKNGKTPADLPPTPQFLAELTGDKETAEAAIWRATREAVADGSLSPTEACRRRK